jgi:hypothetical protein
MTWHLAQTFDWQDTTEDDGPYTLTLADGNGALQFSVATYKGGKRPNVTVADLSSMLTEFITARELVETNDRDIEENPVSLVATNACADDCFLRIWYLSDGGNIVLATYACGVGHQNVELPECESIVRSIVFE